MHLHFTVSLFNQWYCYIGNNFTKNITSYLQILCLLLPSILIHLNEDLSRKTCYVCKFCSLFVC